MTAIANKTFAKSTLMSTIVSNLFIWISPPKRFEAPQTVSGLSYLSWRRRYQFWVVERYNIPKFGGSNIDVSTVVRGFDICRHSAGINNSDSGCVEHPYRRGVQWNLSDDCSSAGFCGGVETGHQTLVPF